RKDEYHPSVSRAAIHCSNASGRLGRRSLTLPRWTALFHANTDDSTLAKARSASDRSDAASPAGHRGGGGSVRIGSAKTSSRQATTSGLLAQLPVAVSECCTTGMKLARSTVTNSCRHA